MLQRIPQIKSKDLISFMLKKGFYIDRQKGSHVILKRSHPNGGIVVVPFHNKNLKRGTLLSILKASGIEVSELRK